MTIKKIFVVLCAALAACSPLAASPGGEVAGSGASISSPSPAAPVASSTAVAVAGSTAAAGCAEVRGAGALHLRQGPGVEYPVIGWMVEGERVAVLDSGVADWWQVRIGGLDGWARAKYLQRVSCEESTK